VSKTTAEAAAPPKGAAAKSSLGRIVVASAVGTALELYDFLLYAYIASLIFERLFFPKFDPLVGTVLVFGSFSIGIISRPLGGLLFGHFGDRIGRKHTLVFTMLLMGISSAAIGVLPGYTQIGVAAPLLLITFRILQGIAIGGESVGGVLMTIENVAPERRGYYGSIIQAAGPVGSISASLALLLVSHLSNDALLSWGWRVPFLFSLPLLIVGYYIRSSVDESPEFEEAARRRKILRVPLMEVLRQHKSATLVVLVASMADTSLFYLATVFTLSYATKTLGIPRAAISDAIMLGSTVSLFTTPLLGAWSDRIGLRRMYMIGLGLLIVTIYPFFLMLESRNALLAGAAVVCAIGIVHSMMWASSASYFPGLFAPNVRFSGTSLGKQVGTVLGGGIIPLIATGLLATGSNGVLLLCGYLALLAGVAILAVFFGERRGGMPRVPLA
jgi:MFS family permease